MQPLIKRFRDIPESALVLNIIKTVDPRLALEVAYASGKKDVIDAVRARILTFRSGTSKNYVFEREFYLTIRKFAQPSCTACLSISEGSLVAVSSVSPDTKMMMKIKTAVFSIIDRINERKFSSLTLLHDTIQQERTVKLHNQVAKNLDIFLNRTLIRYNSSILRLFSDHLVIYAGTILSIAACPLRLSKGTAPLVTATVGERLRIEVSHKKKIFYFFTSKNNISFPGIERPREIHYLAMRVLAELIYRNPNPREVKVDIDYTLRPIAYAVGMIPYNEKAEMQYQKALESGEQFANRNKGLRKQRIAIEVNPKESQTLEKRKEIVTEPILNIIDSDIYKYV